MTENNNHNEDEDFTVEMMFDLARVDLAQDAMIEAVEMISHPEVKEAVIESIGEFIEAFIRGTVNALVSDLDRRAAMTNASRNN